jgi:hypothetical protein
MRAILEEVLHSILRMFFSTQCELKPSCTLKFDATLRGSLLFVLHKTFDHHKATSKPTRQTRPLTHNMNDYHSSSPAVDYDGVERHTPLENGRLKEVQERLVYGSCSPLHGFTKVDIVTDNARSPVRTMTSLARKVQQSPAISLRKKEVKFVERSISDDILAQRPTQCFNAAIRLPCVGMPPSMLNSVDVPPHTVGLRKPVRRCSQ